MKNSIDFFYTQAHTRKKKYIFMHILTQKHTHRHTNKHTPEHTNQHTHFWNWFWLVSIFTNAVRHMTLVKDTISVVIVLSFVLSWDFFAFYYMFFSVLSYVMLYSCFQFFFIFCCHMCFILCYPTWCHEFGHMYFFYICCLTYWFHIFICVFCCCNVCCICFVRGCLHPDN